MSEANLREAICAIGESIFARGLTAGEQEAAAKPQLAVAASSHWMRASRRNHVIWRLAYWCVACLNWATASSSET